MKLLQNKLTREIGCLVCSFGKTPEKITVVECIDGKRGSKVWYYNSLAELNEEWCDYEEPKEYWIIDTILHEIRSLPYKNNEEDKRYEQWLEELGLKFETKEEAEKALEKLKALTEAKKDGLKIKGYYYNHEDLVILADIGKCNKLTLDTLFGKEID